MSVGLIALGSNQGDRRATLEAAVAQMARHPQITVAAVSGWRETTPIGGPVGQPRFLNGAVRIDTSLEPRGLLSFLQQVETDWGRCREEPWGPRTLDLDLLLYDFQVLDEPGLVVPHPRMAWRRFVLEPAAEVAGAMVHPMIGWTVAQLLDHLNTARPYVAVTGPIGVGKTHLAQRLAVATPNSRLVLEQPDWDRLDAFYADPSGLGLATELEFLEHRSRLLAGGGPDWSESHWAVSDFWFDQSAAFARAWLPKSQQPAFFERFEALRGTVVAPKLIVRLDATPGELLSRVRRRGRSCERRLTEDQLDRIRRSVREETERRGLGPVLRADAGDPESVFQQALAALRAME
ncbi:MAG: 2-amino-4-hydroxy-6-hydroxymethyldihydropteridine diphosphokinase [Thermoguttaceae bacterium]